MSSLTRWVLAHKRIVVSFWIVATIAGVMAAGPASEALDQEFSVPEKEGWETNLAIADQYQGTGGDTAPLVPVATLPDGESIDSPGVKADLAKVDARLQRGAAWVPDRLLRLNRRQDLRLRRRPDDLRARLPDARPRPAVRREPRG